MTIGRTLNHAVCVPVLQMIEAGTYAAWLVAAPPTTFSSDAIAPRLIPGAVQEV
jgi:hypothetical protein